MCKEYSGLRAKILKQIEGRVPCDEVPLNIFVSKRCTNRINTYYIAAAEKKLLGKTVDVRY
ncbi:MAG: hypothetical protein P4M11_06825 [Candidatus Pacebacteria bacterium]|nr:hypothetical protein [Candidatus Paceibacterota bacterium]